MNNSSAFVQESSSPLLIISVNISMAVVVFATLCHILALFTIYRLRKKIMSPFMINISVICLVLSIGDYAVTMGTDFKMKTRNNTQAVYLCNWVTFVSLLSKYAFSSTLCAMNIVSKLALDRCVRGVAQQMTRKSHIILFTALWLYSIFMGALIVFEDNLSALSASQLTCNLNWTSRKKLVLLYNALAAITTLLLPMVICFAMQYLCARIWKASRYTQDRSRRRRLVYRRRLNRMVIALTLFFFVLELPCQVGNVVAMTTGYYSYTQRAAFYLEILAQFNVLYPAWVYLLLNTSYRMTLKQLLTGSPRQRTTNARELDVPRGNQRQGAAGRNRDNERARVRFNAKVCTLPQPSTPRSKTNGNIQASGTTSLSKTHQGGTGNDNEERISKDKRSEEQSTDF